MASFNVFTADLPRTAGRWYILEGEAGDPYGHLGPHATSPVSSWLWRPLCWASGRYSLQACFPLLHPTGQAPELHRLGVGFQKIQVSPVPGDLDPGVICFLLRTTVKWDEDGHFVCVGACTHLLPCSHDFT